MPLFTSVHMINVYKVILYDQYDERLQYSIGIAVWVRSKSKSIEWFIEDQAFTPSYGLAPPPPHPTPSLVSKFDRPHTGRLRKRDNLLTGERGKEWGRSQIIRERENLALNKSFNTSWLKAFHDKQHQFRHEKNIFFSFLMRTVQCTYVKYGCIYCMSENINISKMF